MVPDLEEAQRKLEAASERVSSAHLQQLLARREEIERKFSGPLARYADAIKLLFELLRDYSRGDYREIPWRSIAIIVAALFYKLNAPEAMILLADGKVVRGREEIRRFFLLPLEVIPDFVPLLGYLDDTLVIALCLKLVAADLQAYRAWRKRRGRT